MTHRTQPTLQPGSRVKLGGGYDMEPRWLGGREFYLGTLRGFMPGQNALPAAVVQLDQPITFDGVTGRLLVLELRYEGAEWQNNAVVHIELCDFEPEPKPWLERRQGKWIESNATVQLV